MNKKSGFTLIEVVVSSAIALLLLGVVYNMLFVGIKSHSTTLTSFEDQSDIRYSVETVNQIVRYATVAFSVPDDYYSPVIGSSGSVESGLAKNWNYIGLNPEKKALVHYVYNETTSSHDIKVLAQSSGTLTYDLSFKKMSSSHENKLIQYELKGYKDSNETFNITTELEALNAINVIDWGDPTNISIALAYRTEETPEIHKRPIAAMSMVLDTSGSMNDDLNGKSRIKTLRDTLTLMFNTMSTNGGDSIYVSLAPFNRTANVPHENYTEDPEDFKKADDSDWNELISSLKASKGTNTGDGLRRGYYQLLNFNNNFSQYGLESDQEVKNYMVILVDGVTTMASADIYRLQEWGWNWGWRWLNRNEYYYDYIVDESDGDERWFRNYVNPYENRPSETDSSRVIFYGRRTIGYGDALDPIGTNYVDLIGESFIQAKNLNLSSGTKDLNLIDNVFVIGFSDVTSELESVKDIAEAVGINVESDDSDVNNNFVNNDRVFIASNQDELKTVFENIAGYIAEELWQVKGPRID